ncbi:phage tail protein [Pluralibacter gergoviae]|uniref:phage tail protein n=1 Tax=Pluralibacter gergoviae TaxID=61647 RepID=UPI0009B9EEAE|nr:phage tail protein [Pluralibacter gergoviae]SUB69961.1 Phage tail fibre repeat [Pluralibacter gergoviae]HDS1114520.1 phage tail protein [Pluralibacter gergoviae]
MATKFRTIVTKAGAEKFAAALTSGGKKVNITEMAVGDGNGKLPEPDANQTKLVKEVWRHALNKISQDNQHKNYVIAELIIPPETGGFWMREMGIYDDAGTLLAVGNMAESYKPKLEEGSGRAQTVRMVIMLSDIASVDLTIDSTTVMASQDYVDDKIAEHEKSRRHPDATLKEKGFTQLSSATDSDSESLAATPKAVKAVNTNANGRVPSTRKINGHPLSTDITLSPDDLGAFPIKIRGQIKDGMTMAAANQSGWWQVAVTKSDTISDFPKNKNGDALYAFGFLFVKIEGDTWLQHYYSHHGEIAYRQNWTKGPSTEVSWVIDYNSANIPTATDVGAVSKAGDTMTGKLNLPQTSSFGVNTENILSGSSITLGDNDTGIQQEEDGAFYLVANGIKITEIHPEWITVHGDIHSTNAVYSGNAYMTTDGNIWGTRWNPSGQWLWDAIQVNLTARDNDINNRATWDYVNGTFSKVSTAGMGWPGWWKCASTGLIIQFGSVGTGDDLRVNFPIGFPNACAAVCLSQNNSYHGADSTSNISATGRDQWGFTAHVYKEEIGADWIAIGW